LPDGGANACLHWQQTAWFDWVCEIPSPNTVRENRAIKLPVYAREGVICLWLMDPDPKTLEAYELRVGKWTLLATLHDDQPVSLPPFDAIEFQLSVLWP
jgi:Uma2 family endonuclease